MTTSPFDHSHYKAFILKRIEISLNGGRGVRRQLAEAMNCQVAYVSHVLAGDKHLSLEQAEAAARFFVLREEELEFFLLQVESARAGTPSLKKHLARQLERRQTEYRELHKQIQISDAVLPADQAAYYSSWHYQAIRTLITIPEFRQTQTIAQRLGLDIERVNEVLTFLLHRGLVRETRDGYLATEKQIHLPRTSPLISKLHTNWRVRTLSVLDRMRPDDYHYSGVVTLSEEDMGKVREILVKALQKSVEVIKPSREERLCVLAMDFFEL